MRSRRLGRSGPSVSAVGFGAWALGGNTHGNSYGSTDDATSVAAVRKALDLGCTFFDTADVYGWGHSEKLLGKALQGRREGVVLATKVGGDFYHGGVRMDFSPGHIRFALTKSLERLGTHYVDLYQLHNPPLSLIGDPTTYRVLEELKSNGSIRHYGVSIHDPAEGLAAMEAASIASVQVVFNLMERGPEEALLPAASANEVGIIAREPLWNGYLSGKFTGEEEFEPGDIRARWPEGHRRQRAAAAAELKRRLAHGARTLAQAAIAFALSRPAVSVVIPGCKSPAQVEENFAAAQMTWNRTDEEGVAELLKA